MKAEEEIKQLIDELGWWVHLIKARSCVSFTDINRVSEGLAAELLNAIYNLELIDLNSIRPNTPGIDLGDSRNRIAFQVTASTTAKKILTSLQTITPEDLEKYSTGIRFFILSLTDGPKVDLSKARMIVPNFNPQTDILTVKRLIRQIQPLYLRDQKRFVALASLLKRALKSSSSMIRTDETECGQLLRVFMCAPSFNRGQSIEKPGELMHHHGHVLEDNCELKSLGVDYPLWEWTRHPCGIKARRSTIIYGPYISAFGIPGMYLARFRLKGLGFKRIPSCESHHLLELDVHRVGKVYYRNRQEDEIAQKQMTKRTITLSDLSDEEWHDFDLNFYYTGEDDWEFRISAFDGTGERPDHIKLFGESVRIYFDSISIYQLHSGT